MTLTRAQRRANTVLPAQPEWFRDAVVYELHVRTFADSNGDGVGDFRGLTEHLAYLQDLGVTALWLLPFYPSPLRDEGYDTSDYLDINPAYGNLRDFRRFLDEAHRRGLRVITELVLNHTSDQHPWFQRARTAPRGSRWRDWYVWSDDPNRYAEARVIFQDFEPSNWTWDRVAEQYYWHRFYSHQPDLNYDHPDVRREMLRTVEHWFDLGVDGLRLDAVPYLFERDGTNCENLPETHAFLRDLRAHLDERYADRALIAEANQWPEDAIAYFGSGDECHMAFHFPLMPRLFMALHMEDRFPIVDILRQTPAAPSGCQWGLFLRNHDELTLEMVTDEERDYMYRVYAHDPAMRVNLGIRRRLAPLLRDHRQKFELMHGLLCSLPGTPFLYYGDEIGMGDNVYLGDRNGVRTPMQWSGDRNAGFSTSNPQRLCLPVVIDPEYHYETVNVANQLANPDSRLWWIRRLVALRQRARVFGTGTLDLLAPDNPKVLAFLRRPVAGATDDSERRPVPVLVVANLSRFAQFAELDLTEFRGVTPVELFGRTPFPRVGELPYLLTLAPHSFYWFALTSSPADRSTAWTEPVPTLACTTSWKEIFDRPSGRGLADVLPRILRNRRWFAAKARRIAGVRIDDRVTISWSDDDGAHEAVVVIARVEYLEGESETYLVPVSFLDGAAADHFTDEQPDSLLAVVRPRDGEPGVLVDAMALSGFGAALLDTVLRRRRLPGVNGSLRGTATSSARDLASRARSGSLPRPSMLHAEQSNSSLRFGEDAIVKLVRRLEGGDNPEVEVGSALTRAGFPHAAPLLGSLEYHREGAPTTTVAVAQRYVAHEDTAWHWFLDVADRYLEAALTDAEIADEVPATIPHPLDLIATTPGPVFDRLAGSALPSAELLGRRIGEMHVALAAIDEPAFRPEPATFLSQRALYQSMRTTAQRAAARRRAVGRAPPRRRARAGARTARPRRRARRPLPRHPRRARRPPDPHPRRSAPGSGAVDRQRLRRRRLRRRAGPDARRTARAALTAA